MSNEFKEGTIEQVRNRYFKIKVEILNGGKLPYKANQTDAGFDLYATEDIAIYPGQLAKHPLNIRLQFPAGTWAEITSKSGLGSQGLLVFAGVIDQEYRGIPHVVMSNIWVMDRLDEDGYPLMRTNPIVIKKGEKLAQMIMSPYSPEYFIEQVEQVDTNTTRGAGGFGSTGKT
jgi:dUTP pyrophosphatase